MEHAFPRHRRHEHLCRGVSEAIAHRNLTLERLSHRLRAAGTPVSIATLSYWQTGRSMPTRARSRKALLELEKILSLPPCRLVNALPGDAYTLWAAERVVPDNEIVTEVLAGMGLDMERRFTGVVNLDETTIGPDHTEQSVFIQQLLRTEQDGWNRFPLVSQQETELEATPEIEALNGCTLGQVVKVPSARMLVAELLLPRKLARGEQHFISYRINSAPSNAVHPGSSARCPTCTAPTSPASSSRASHPAGPAATCAPARTTPPSRPTAPARCPGTRCRWTASRSRWCSTTR